MANTYTPNMNLAKPAKGDVNWDDEVNGNCDKLDPLGVDHYTGSAGTGYHKNTLHVGDGSASDMRVSIANDHANKPYLGYDDGTSKFVFANDGVTELELASHLKTGGLWVVSGTSGNDTTGDGSWGKPYATIPKAVTEASAGDTILVLPGDYALGGSTITVSKVVHIIGLGPREGIRITGSSATYLIDISTAATLENLTLTMTGTSGNQVALRCGGSGAKIRNIRIDNQATGANSHAIKCDYGPAVWVENCRFAAYNGYALRLMMASGSGGATFRLCEFIASNAVGVYIVDATSDDMTFDRCIIAGGNGNYGVEYAAVVTGNVLRYCVVKKEGAAAESIHVSAAQTMTIFFCALNAILDTDITNSIGTPYNVVDADVT